jgi:signal transduction histidine kinase
LHGAVPLRGNDDTIVGAIAVGEDVTALLAAEEQARNAVRARDEMMRVVSHDLRTPLAVVIGQGQLLATNASSEEREIASGRIVRAARRMQRLVDDLLDTSRIDARLLKVEPKLHSIPPVLEDAAELARSIVRDREIRVHTPPVLPSVCVDRDRVQQVLANLVDNAVRHTRPGGHVTLGVRLDGAPEEVTWYVEDDGAGIAQDELPHVFDRYWQGTAATRGALGLGLSICKAIVEAHGGRIWAESTPGLGATFAFTTPATPLADALDPPASEPVPA